MDFDREIERRAQIFVDAGMSLDEYHVWLAEHAQDVARSNDSFVQSLDGRSWLLLSEHQNGFLSEKEVRRDLAEFLEANGRSSAPLSRSIRVTD